MGHLEVLDFKLVEIRLQHTMFGIKFAAHNGIACAHCLKLCLGSLEQQQRHALCNNSSQSPNPHASFILDDALAEQCVAKGRLHPSTQVFLEEAQAIWLLLCQSRA